MLAFKKNKFKDRSSVTYFNLRPLSIKILIARDERKMRSVREKLGQFSSNFMTAGNLNLKREAAISP
jgi:hypothetical protein